MKLNPSMKNIHIQFPQIFIFFLLIYLIPIYWLVNPDRTSKRSLIEGRSLIDFPTLQLIEFKLGVKRILQGKSVEANEIFFGQFFERTFQTSIEKATSDQFPMRMDAIHFSKGVDRKIISLAYAFLSDQAVPADMKSGLYVLRDQPILIEVVSKYSSSSQSTIDNRITNYESLIEKYPYINFYLFYLERLSNSPYHPLIPYFWNADNRQAFNYFNENRSEKLIFDDMLLSNIEDHKQFFYHTDHHWNIQGALRAYDVIYFMLKNNYSDISPLIQHDRYTTFPEMIFLGSSARESFFPIEPEVFQVANIQLPSYTIYENGEEIDYGRSEDYLSGKYSKEPYVSHYSQFYGFDKPFLEYHFVNNSQRNLIIFSSSFANSIEAMIASHYKTTYVVDLRYFEDFSFSKFVSDKDIQDVLILGDNLVAFQSSKWLINP